MTHIRGSTVGAALAALLLLAACGSGGQSNQPGIGSSSLTSDPTMTRAADLRTRLDLLLQEQVVLSAKVTGSLLGGRAQESAAYGRALNDNGTAISDVIGAALGDDIRSRLNKVWIAHDGFLAGYTRAAAAGDRAGRQGAVDNLTRDYVPQLAQLISSSTGVALTTLTPLATTQVQEAIAIVDAQAATQWAPAYTNIRQACAHVQMLGDAISAGIVQTVPARYAGDPESRSAGFRVGLDGLLQEHLFLASSATDAALGGRADEFAAATVKLSSNGTDLGSVIGGLYGGQAAAQFNQLWSAHNGFVVDYARAVAAGDPAARQQAMDQLTNAYVRPFAAFLAGVTGSPTGTMQTLLAAQVTATAAVVDAQHAALTSKSYGAAVAGDTGAAHRMEMIGDPLATAIVARLPGRFR